MKPLAIVDAGPLIGAAITTDSAHGASVAALSDFAYELIIPAMCVAEACYMIAGRQGPLVEARFLEGLRGFEIVAPGPDDLVRMAELVRQYADFPLGGSDACVVALAERFDTDTVITLDRCHFGAIRPLHCERLRLLPE